MTRRPGGWPRAGGGALALAILLIASACAPSSCQAADTAPAPQDFYRDRIRPILADSCWRCHGERKQRSGLRLDTRAGVLHGGHNPDVVPGHPETSRLMDALSYEDEDLKMPPDEKLTDQQIADIASWIRMGVPWDDRDAPTGQRPAAAPAGR
jgi:cytochrome c553